MGLSATKRAEARATMHAQGVLPRYLSVYELAALMLRHEKTIYSWAQTSPERLPRVTRIADRIMFDARDVEAWFDGQRGRVVDRATSPGPAMRKRGRPTKVEQARRRDLASSSASVQQ